MLARASTTSTWRGAAHSPGRARNAQCSLGVTIFTCVRIERPLSNARRTACSGSNRTTLAGGFGVSDDLVLRVMATAFKHLKLVIEPGGAVALAAALDRRLPAGTECAVAVASGGNVDAEMFTRALQTETLV